MKLPKEAVEEFQQLYNSQSQIKITFEEAEIKAVQFLKLFKPISIVRFKKREGSKKR